MDFVLLGVSETNLRLHRVPLPRIKCPRSSFWPRTRLGCDSDDRGRAMMLSDER
jgi:hypothetical protein